MTILADEKKRVRRHVYMRDTVRALIHRAIDMGHARLPGLLDLTEKDIVEKHDRYHTVPITPQHAKGAKPGDACDCVIAHAAVELPEVYAAIILRRYAYFLEKDDRGRLKVFRYKSPEQARQLTVRFDKGRATKRTVVTFAPLPRSMHRAAQRRYAARWYAGRTPGKRSEVGWRPGNYRRTLLPVRLLQPVEKRT